MLDWIEGIYNVVSDKARTNSQTNVYSFKPVSVGKQDVMCGRGNGKSWVIVLLWSGLIMSMITLHGTEKMKGPVYTV